MNAQTLNEEMLKRYLLGDISEEEQQIIEERFLQDDSFFDEMLALEDEMYFDYQQNRLSQRERATFEQKFLKSAKDKEKSAFAEAFLQATSEIAEKKNAEVSASPKWWQSIAAFFNYSNRALQFSFAAILLLLLLGAIGLFIQNTNRQDEIANLGNNRHQEQTISPKQQQQNNPKQQPENEKPQSNQNENQTQETEVPRPPIEPEIASNNQPAEKDSPQPPKKTTQSPSEQRSVIAMVLSPGLFTRSGGQGFQRVTITPHVKNLQIRLLLKTENDYKSYRTVLKKLDEETQVWANADLKPQRDRKNKSLILNIPANILQRADYEISLVGITASGETEEITSYYFSVVKNSVKKL